MKKRFFLAALFVLLSINNASASDAQITNAIFQTRNFGKPDATISATFTVSWKYAWRNRKNHDAVWVIFKLRKENETRSHRHGILKKPGAKLIHNYLAGSTDPEFWIPDDATGIMIYPARDYRGDLSWRVQVELDVPKIQNFSTDGLTYINVHPVEMVQIPQRVFYAGDSDPEAQKSTAAFYEHGTNAHYRVASENAITVGTQTGNLHYNNNNEAQYRGDSKGPVPAEFPKGFNGFYVMKYELSQGLYTDFLNSIAAYWTTNRANFGGRFYTKQRGSIYLEDGVYKTASRDRPASFLSFEDSAAWADWAALRPMTELEFEKAARGPDKPVANDFPWGTDSRAKLSRYFNDAGDFVWQAPLDEKDLNDANKEFFGASYYWVMDLNKGLWERCITLGDEKGRAFKGTHGDGVLKDGYFGVASNEDWPNGIDGKGGLSYRGGGFYNTGTVGSPEGQVGHRQFGSWGDGPRDVAYGFRAARSSR